MKKFFGFCRYLTIALILIGLCVLVACQDNDPISETPKQNHLNGEGLLFKYAGLERHYKIYVPQNLPKNAPLVIVLHGMNQSNDWSYGLGFNEVAEKSRSLVSYPQANIIDDRKKGAILWNDANNDTGVDDIGFLSELAKNLQAEYSLNPDQTFVAGFSNGGFMSYTLACKASNVFKAVAAVAALMNSEAFTNCNPSTPIPILHIHGTDDATVPITGLKNKDGSIMPPSVADIINLWATLNNCSSVDSGKISDNTTAYFHRNGTGGNEVHYYEINNHDHLWPGLPVDKVGYIDNSGINATGIIWDFFSKYWSITMACSGRYAPLILHARRSGGIPNPQRRAT